MQLFSRKKALLAASLSALSVLGACGDDVTVTQPVSVVTVAISPPSQTLNIGESANFSVQITGGTSSTPATLTSCTSSNTAVATATVQSGACRVTAVSAGNATVTATSGTASASASVTVSAASAAISNLQLSPSTANVAVGQSVTIVPNVTRAATAVTTTFAYATSNAAVATVNATTGVITAVAPGIATITVTATGTGTGYTTTSLSGGVTVNVTAAPAGVSSLSVQPTSATLAVGGTLPLAASASQPSGAPAAVITYGTNAPATATVSAAGVITAVAPGSAVITVTATSPAGNGFGASTLSQLVPVTVTPQAQVIISSLTDNGAPIDITNVFGQFEVNMQLQPNGQNVSSVQAFVCDQGEAQAACIARGPAAQQTFGSAGGQAGPIQLYINSAEFTPPNFTTGADANTLYKNGLKTMIATVTTTAPSTAPTASNNLSQIAFNNQDGFTIQWNQPANRATDAGNITWYGGPSTPDALIPGAQSGTGSFVVVPVIYTPNRTIAQVTLGFTSDNGNFVCGNNILDTARPFGASYGTDARVATATGAINFNCGTNLGSGVAGAVSGTNGYVPVVVASVDNNNAAGPNNGGITPAAATSIYTPVGAAGPTFAGRYRQSLSFRPTTIFIPGDHQSPVVVSYDVRGGGGTGVYVDSAWVNGSYNLAGGFSSSTGNPLRLNVTDNGVGLLGSGGTTSARNTQFNICARAALQPASTPSAPVNCSTPVATGGITSTVASINLGENAIDFTNTAYVSQVVETDRLGNRGMSVLFTWNNTSTGAGQSATAGTNTGAATPQAFGVDVTSPTLVAIPNTGAGAAPNYVRTDVDSVYANAASALGNTYGTTNGTNAVFGIRFTDNRAGFPTCVATNCVVVAGDVRGGSFQITRRQAPAIPSLTNDAVVTSLVNSTSNSGLFLRNSINAQAGTFSGDPSIREFYIPIFGDATRNNASTVPTINDAQAGYYTFSGTLVDRAGNTTAIPSRSVALDNARPVVSSIAVPPLLVGGTMVGFQPTGGDDLEAISGDLALRYPQLGYANGTDGAPVAGQATTIRFRRLPNFGTTAALGLWHNPFQSLTDNKLATPIGPGTLLGSSPLNVPGTFLQNVTTTNAGGAPLTQAQIFALGNLPKPDQVTAWLYDIRGASTVTPAFADSGRSLPINAAIGTAQVPGPSSAATAKDWTSATGAGIQTWAVFNPAASTSSIEFRAQTSTSVTNPPFTSVAVIRQVGTGAGIEWEYLGQATYAGPLDQGALRFWRYTFSYAGVNQGQFTTTSLANGDVIRGIGSDAAGNGLSTNNTTVGQAPALPTNATVVQTPATPASFTNAAVFVDITLTPSSNPNGASTVAGCSTNSAFLTASVQPGNVCRLTPAGVVSSTVNVVVTYTLTGSAAGFSTNTITTTANTTRIP